MIPPEITKPSNPELAPSLASIILAQARSQGLVIDRTHDELVCMIEHAVAGDKYLNSFLVGVSMFAPHHGSCADVTLRAHECGEYGVKADAAVSWTSLHNRPVSSALHAISNYRKVVDFAAFIESYLS